MALTFVDLFSGAGGLSCGLEMAGHRCLLGVDSDKHAIKTFAQNHKEAAVYSGDIRELKGKKLFDLLGTDHVDLVVGGPPCQGFSTVGLGDPKDTRNLLFQEYCRIVKTLKPLFIVMENVTGLLAKKNEKTLESILKTFSKMGYHMEVKVLAAHQYGVPEIRRRTIFIGSRVNDGIEFPIPTHDTIVGKSYIPAVTVGEALGRLSKNPKKNLNHDLQAAEIKSEIDRQRLAHVPEGKGIRYPQDEKTYLPPRLHLGVDWEKMPEGRFRQTKFKRLDRSSPSPTIMTGRETYFHPTEARYLTAREAATLQSFPEDFVFHGTLSAQWRQIGNAVPPLLAKAIGMALNSMLHKSTQSEKLVTKKKKLVANSIQGLRKHAFHYKKNHQEEKSPRPE